MSLHPADGHLPLVIRRAATLQPTPWKNGRGVTCEVAACPDGASLDDFVWRASMAEVANDGDFSFFPGIDRTIVLLGGAGMELDLHGGPLDLAHSRHALREPFAAFDFSGEAPLKATLVDGPTHDFNLMVRRDQASGGVDVWRGPGAFALPMDTVLLFVVRGTAQLLGADSTQSASVTLDACDSVKLNDVARESLSIELPANAVALAVRVRLHDTPSAK